MPKYILYFYLFVFIFISIGSIKADPTVLDELDVEVNTKEVTGVTFNSAGTRLFVTGSRGNDRVSEYSLSVGFDLSSTVTHLGFISNHEDGLGPHDPLRDTGGFRPQDIEFSNDGSKMFLPMHAGTGTSGVHQLDMSTPFDISTADSEYYFAPASVTSGTPTGIEFNGTGTKMFLSIGSEIKEYTLSSAFDLQSTVTLVRSVDLSAQTDPNDDGDKPIKELIFNDNGTILFVTNKNPHNIYEYSLSSAFDLSNVTFIAKTEDNFVRLAPAAGFEASPAALAFNDTGSKLFFAGRDQNLVIESSLPGNYTLNLPTLSSHVPADDATGISEVADIVLNFSEIVEAASTEKFITIKKGNDVVEAIDVRGSQVTGSGSTQITVNPSVTLESQTAYHLLIDNGAIVDTAGASYAGISSDSTFNFTTGDTRPTLISSTPSDNASGVARDANIVLTFSEIVDVENGNITINNSSDDSVFESINVTSSNVTGTGTNQITINPTSRFEASTDYYILIDATAFDNVSGISYVGISSTTSLNFTTISISLSLFSGIKSVIFSPCVTI